MKLSRRQLQQIIKEEMGRLDEVYEDSVIENPGTHFKKSFAVDSQPSGAQAYYNVLRDIFTSNAMQQAFMDYAISGYEFLDGRVHSEGWDITVSLTFLKRHLAERLGKNPNELSQSRIYTLIDPPRILKNAIEGNGYGFELIGIDYDRNDSGGLGTITFNITNRR